MVSKLQQRVILYAAFIFGSIFLVQLFVTPKLGTEKKRTVFRMSTPKQPPGKSTSVLVKNVDKKLVDEIGALKRNKERLSMLPDQYNCKEKVLFIQSSEINLICPAEERIGGFGDGGKWICQPRQLIGEDDSCVVYSFGSNLNFEFENGIDAINPNCEIHIFDPTPHVSKSARLLDLPSNFFFHPLGLVGKDRRLVLEGENVATATVGEIMADLKHDRLTVLKIDIEGSEWGDITFEGADVWSRFGVILMELHISMDETLESFTSLKARMEGFGFALYHTEVNNNDNLCWEFAWIKKDIRFKSYSKSMLKSMASADWKNREAYFDLVKKDNRPVEWNLQRKYSSVPFLFDAAEPTTHCLDREMVLSDESASKFRFWCPLLEDNKMLSLVSGMAEGADADLAVLNSENGLYTATSLNGLPVLKALNPFLFENRAIVLKPDLTRIWNKDNAAFVFKWLTRECVEQNYNAFYLDVEQNILDESIFSKTGGSLFDLIDYCPSLQRLQLNLHFCSPYWLLRQNDNTVDRDPEPPHLKFLNWLDEMAKYGFHIFHKEVNFLDIPDRESVGIIRWEQMCHLSLSFSKI